MECLFNIGTLIHIIQINMNFPRNGFLVVPAFLMLMSCSEDNPWSGSTDEGAIRLSLQADGRVEGVASSRATTDENGITVPDEGDFSIRVAKTDGTLSKTFSSIDEFRSEKTFPIGDYTIEAFYGEEKAEGFEKPYFHDSANLTVRPGEVTTVSLTATLAKALAEVTFSDELRNVYPTAVATLTSNNETFVEYADGEDRAAYFNPGEINVNLTLTNRQGQTVTIKPAGFKADARHLYTVRFGANQNPDGSGSLILKVDFDDSVEAETVDIDLSDELFTMAMPVITCEGFTSGTAILASEGSYMEGYRMNVIAAAGIASAELSFESDKFSPVFGNKIDLMKATAEEQTQLEAIGIRALGFFRNPDRSAFIDFSGFLSQLPAGNHSVSLIVSDVMGRVSEPAVLTVNVEAVEIDATVPVPPAFQGNSVDVVVSTNNTAVKDAISFSVSDASGVLQNAEVKNIEVVSTRSGMDYTYKYTVEIPVNETSYIDIAVKYAGKIVKTINQPKNMPDYTVQTDAFANKVYFKIEAEGSSLTEAITRSIVLMDGENEVAESRITRKISQGILEVTGFSPATTYSDFRTAISSASNPDKKTVAPFTTEAAAGVPNGDFESLNSVYNMNLNQGGTWTITALGSATKYQTTVSINVSEPQGWASNNAMPMSGSPDNTWFKTPCVYASNLSWIVKQPSAKVWNIGQSEYTETPDVYKNFAVQSGSSSVIIRNVAWDAAGSVPSNNSQTGNTDYSNYYNNKTATCSRKAGGKLFLGTYSYSGSSENISEGVTFTSRPSVLKGYYKYVNDQNNTSEKGKVVISIMSGSSVIASGEVALAAASSMTAFEIPLSYTTFSGKQPTHLRIMISSTDKTVESEIPVTAYCTKQEQSYRGAELTVDNLTFEY